MNSAAVFGLKNYIPAAATKQDRGERNELMLCGGSERRLSVTYRVPQITLEGWFRKQKVSSIDQ